MFKIIISICIIYCPMLFSAATSAPSTPQPKLQKSEPICQKMKPIYVENLDLLNWEVLPEDATKYQVTWGKEVLFQSVPEEWLYLVFSFFITAHEVEKKLYVADRNSRSFDLSNPASNFYIEEFHDYFVFNPHHVSTLKMPSKTSYLTEDNRPAQYIDVAYTLDNGKIFKVLLITNCFEDTFYEFLDELKDSKKFLAISRSRDFNLDNNKCSGVCIKKNAGKTVKNFYGPLYYKRGVKSYKQSYDLIKEDSKLPTIGNFITSWSSEPSVTTISTSTSTDCNKTKTSKKKWPFMFK